MKYPVHPPTCGLKCPGFGCGRVHLRGSVRRQSRGFVREPRANLYNERARGFGALLRATPDPPRDGPRAPRKPPKSHPRPIRTAQETQEPPRGTQGAPRRPEIKKNNTKTIVFIRFRENSVAAAKSRPRRPKGGPRSRQDGAREAGSSPRAGQERPKSRQE